MLFELQMSLTIMQVDCADLAYNTGPLGSGDGLYCQMIPLGSVDPTKADEAVDHGRPSCCPTEVLVAQQYLQALLNRTKM